MPVFAGIL